MNTAQAQALADLLARLTAQNWTLDKTTLRTNAEGRVEVKAVPAWAKGWGSRSFAWYFITPEGRIRS